MVIKAVPEPAPNSDPDSIAEFDPRLLDKPAIVQPTKGGVRLKLYKIQIMPFFHLIDEDGETVDETSAQPITMYPKKFLPFDQLVKELENSANAKQEDVVALAKRKLW